MGLGGRGGMRHGRGHHHMHPRHHLFRHRRLMHHSFNHRRRHFWNRRVGFRSRLYGHYWGYNPFFYTQSYVNGGAMYAVPALQFQLQTLGPRPKVNFKLFKVHIVRQSDTAPTDGPPEAFDVTCPDSSGSGDQIAMLSPVDGQRFMVTVPPGVKAGGVFKVAPPPPLAGAWSGGGSKRSPRQQVPEGAVVGQRIAVDTTGDGVNDTHGTLHDTDGDGIPDAVAVDYDGDGIIDQFIPLELPSGQSASVRVVLTGASTMDVMLPAGLPVTLKTIVDAVESFMEGELAKRYENQDNVEDLDFAVQFARLSDQLQWVNGQFLEGKYQPHTMSIVVPEGAKPGQIIQVSPPPGYDPTNSPFPVTLPSTASPGSRLAVVLPDVIPEGTVVAEDEDDDDIGGGGGGGGGGPSPGPGVAKVVPTATPVTTNRSAVAPVSETQSLAQQQREDAVVTGGWEWPTDHGTFGDALAANGNMLEIRGCETVTFYNQEIQVSTASSGRCSGRRIMVYIFVFFVVVLMVAGIAVAAATLGPKDYSRGTECTNPPALGGDTLCWDRMTWGTLESKEYQDEWVALGWTEVKWTEGDSTGTASIKAWGALTADELVAAVSLGFTSSNWVSGGFSNL